MSNKIHVIYDNRVNFHDEQRLADEFAEQGVEEYELYPAIIDRISVPESINASHKMLVQMAKDKKMPYIIIAEQDVTFPSKRGWKYFLENMPKSFDLYLACTYCMPVTNHKVCGFHLYAVSGGFYDDFLSVPETAHIDTAMDDLKGEYHFLFPVAALQRSGYSSNNGAVTNYNMILNESDIYTQ